MIYLMTIKNSDGRVGQILSGSFEVACKGLDWHVVDCKLINAQIIEYYVIEKEELKDSRPISSRLQTVPF